MPSQNPSSLPGTSVLPWVPDTTAAITLRMIDLDYAVSCVHNQKERNGGDSMYSVKAEVQVRGVAVEWDLRRARREGKRRRPEGGGAPAMVAVESNDAWGSCGLPVPHPSTGQASPLESFCEREPSARPDNLSRPSVAISWDTQSNKQNQEEGKRGRRVGAKPTTDTPVETSIAGRKPDNTITVLANTENRTELYAPAKETDSLGYSNIHNSQLINLQEYITKLGVENETPPSIYFSLCSAALSYAQRSLYLRMKFS